MNSLWKIPLFDLCYDDAEERAVAAVLRSKWLTMGPNVKAFEERFAEEILGSKDMHCVAVSSCTCALELAVMLLVERAQGSSKKPLVLVPDITFAATANAALMAGADVEFVDIESDNKPIMSAEDLKQKLERFGSRVAAVLPVHYAGFDGSSHIRGILNDANIPMIEDAAHATGGAYAGTDSPLGTQGEMSCFSFFSNKNLSMGEGGLLATRDEALANKVRLLRSHGMTSTTFDRHTGRLGEYDIVFPGHNYRMGEINAALGLAQLEKLKKNNARRRELYALYCSTLHNVSGLRVCFGDDRSQVRETASGHILPLICADPEQRARIIETLTENRIQTSHHYKPLSKMSMWVSKYGEAEFPNAFAFAANEITLPLYPKMTDADVSTVCRLVLEAACR